MAAMTSLARTALWPVVLALLVADVTSSLETSMLLTALPRILLDPAIGGNGGWLVTAFVLAQIASAAVGGRCGDQFGRRRVLLVALVLCFAGSLVSGLSPSFAGIVAGRIAQGASGAILPLSYGIIRDAAKERGVRFWIGIVSGAYSAAGALGFIAGGALTDSFGWRSIFHVTAALPIVACGLVLACVPRDGAKTTSQSPANLVVGLVFIPAIAAMLLGLDQKLAAAWPIAVRVGLVVGGAIVLAAWAGHQRRSPRRLINVSLLADRGVCISALIYFALGLGGIQLALVTLLQFQMPVATGVGLGLSAAAAGLLKLPSNILSGISGWLGGSLAERRGSRASVLTGSIVLAAGWGWLSLRHGTIADVVAGTMLSSFGTGMILAGAPGLVIESVPADRTSEATGLANVGRGLGTAIGAQIVTELLAMFTVRLPGLTPAPSPLGLNLVLGWIFGVTTAGVLLAALAPKQGLPDRERLFAALGPTRSHSDDRPAG